MSRQSDLNFFKYMKKRQTLYCDRKINNLNRLHKYYDEKVDKE